jgi:hypothetical protein
MPSNFLSSSGFTTSAEICTKILHYAQLSIYAHRFLFRRPVASVPRPAQAHCDTPVFVAKFQIDLAKVVQATAIESNAFQ